jgi:hypothetical protein
VQRILSGGLWDEVERLAATAERKLAAVAYVSSDHKVSFCRRDVLITDASDEAISTGQTSASVLRAAHERGAALYCVPGLHAKILCLGRHVVVGSANLSENSVGKLVEVALVTDNPKSLAESRAFIESVRRTATVVDDGFLSRIEAIPVTRRIGNSRSSSSPQVVIPSGRTWLVGVSPISDRIAEAEQELAEAGEEAAEGALTEDDSSVAWLRFTGASGFRREAQPGDTVIQIWRPTPKSKGAHVYFPAPILRRQDEATCTRFYIEAFSDEEARSISWTDFGRIWKSTADTKVPPFYCARLLPDRLVERLLGLWPTLD